jgi:hypothetical protein
VNSIRSLQVLCMLAIFASLPVKADITRSCTGSLDVSVNDKLPNAWTNLASFEGSASCKNKLHANDCRRSARAEIDRCMSDLWTGRNSNAIPASCNNPVGGSRSGVKLEYDGILLIKQPQRLIARGAYQVCCKLRPKADKLVMHFDGRIVGDEKCAATKTGKDRYQDEFSLPEYNLNCTEWRKQGICG